MLENLKMKKLQEYYELFKGPCGDGDKGTYHSYIDIYENYFSSFKNKNINFLEIGISNGKSIRLWESYFDFAKIYAVDINNKNHLNLTSDRVTIYHDDATKLSFSENFKEQYFSIIVDDGSHILKDQINSFKNLKEKLCIGGLYIIEDVLESHIKPIQDEFDECFKILDLRHERPNCNDNILMIYEKNE